MSGIVKIVHSFSLVSKTLRALIVLGGFLLLSDILFSSLAHAELDPKLIAPLVFSNNVHCAQESALPTRSAWLMVDAFNAGKLGFNFASQRGTDPELESKKAMSEFRKELGKLATDIASHLADGTLPWLPEPGSNEWSSSEIGKKVEVCQGNWTCEPVQKMLQKQWDWKNFFSVTRTHPEHSRMERVSCARIKEFSILQSNLRLPRVDQKFLEELAKANLKSDTWLESCSDESALEDRRFLFQLDLGLDKSSSRNDFEKNGFSFWHSFKVYLSWAWRNNTNPSWLRSLPIEEMIYLVSNSCRNVDRPKCNADFTTQQTLGWLASEELDKPLSWIPDERPPGVDHAPARASGDLPPEDSYLKDIQKKLQTRRSEVRTRFTESQLSFESILSKYSPAELMKEPFLTAPYQRDLTLLCNEVLTAGDLEFGIAKNAIDAFRRSQSLRELVDSVTPEQWSKYQLAIFDLLHLWVNECQTLEKARFAPDPTVTMEDQKTWRQEWQHFVPAEGSDSADAIAKRSALTPEGNYSVSIVTAGGVPEKICKNGLDCTRKLLEATMGFASLAYYSEGLSPLINAIQSPIVNSPDSASVACGQYNPWREQHRANAYLGYGILSSLVFAALPVQGFIGVLPDSKSPHHWQPVWKPNGELVFEPVYARTQSDFTLAIDASSWVGAPCSLMYANTAVPISLGDPILPTRLRVVACNQQDHTQIRVESGTGISDPRQKERSICFQCALKVPELAQSILLLTTGTLSAPVKAGIQLFGTLAHWIKLRTDWTKMPRSQIIYPELLTDSYLKYGTITKRCARRLGKGKECL